MSNPSREAAEQLFPAPVAAHSRPPHLGSHVAPCSTTASRGLGHRRRPPGRKSLPHGPGPPPNSPACLLCPPSHPSRPPSQAGGSRLSPAAGHSRGGPATLALTPKWQLRGYGSTSPLPGDSPTQPPPHLIVCSALLTVALCRSPAQRQVGTEARTGRRNTCSRWHPGEGSTEDRQLLPSCPSPDTHDEGAPGPGVSQLDWETISFHKEACN